MERTSRKQELQIIVSNEEAAPGRQVIKCIVIILEVLVETIVSLLICASSFLLCCDLPWYVVGRGQAFKHIKEFSIKNIPSRKHLINLDLQERHNKYLFCIIILDTIFQIPIESSD